jgi:drug/metabolite transporter (DMT)-like permease
LVLGTILLLFGSHQLALTRAKRLSPDLLAIALCYAVPLLSLGLLHLLFGDSPNHWFYFRPNRLSGLSIVVMSAYALLALVLLIILSFR